MRAMRMNRRGMVMTDENNDYTDVLDNLWLGLANSASFPNLSIKTCILRSLRQKSMYVKCLVTKTMF